VEVRLEDGEPSFEIVPDRAYDFIEWCEALAAPRPSLSYFGTLALRRPATRATAERFLRQHEPPVFLDVNLRPPWWEVDGVHRLLQRAQEVKLNEDELARLVPEEDGLEGRARHLMSRFGPRTLYVTRGPRGALAFTSDGETEEVRPAGSTSVVDTVGAGDALSAVLILGRSRGWTLPTTLGRAQDFAAAIVGRRGATVADRSFYEAFADTWRLR
jgi:fructokinase